MAILLPASFVCLLSFYLCSQDGAKQTEESEENLKDGEGIV